MSATQKLIGPKRRLVSSPRNSICNSASLDELDWRNWWADDSCDSYYLHVRANLERNNFEETWHRVYCRQSDKPRLSMKGGELYWLIDEEKPPTRP